MNNRFSHIYIEERALNYTITKDVLDKFSSSKIIKIKHYKDVFNRSGQNFQLQKSSQKLILAVKEENYIYKGPDICQDFGNSNFYYTSTLLNCIYNCDYCFLQGMYPSANIVAFVNIDDFFNGAASLEKGAYLTLSYDTDLLAFENIIPYTSMWIGFAKKCEDIKLEIRTKSVNYNAISHLDNARNLILAWTLSPDTIINKYEKLAPTLDSRLNAINKAIAGGWKVRLCFDPIIKTDNWKKVYSEFIDKVFSSVQAVNIFDVSIGTFRMSGEYLKKLRKLRFDSELIYYPFECINGVSGYPPEVETELLDFVYYCIAQYIDKRRIFL